MVNYFSCTSDQGLDTNIVKTYQKLTEFRAAGFIDVY